MAYTTINKPSDHFNTTTWTGDSTTPKTFTTGTFKPDLLWGKDRSQAYNHQLFDTTRGAGNDKELVSSSDGAEGASNPETYGYVSAFTSTGFTFTRGTDSAGDDYWNESPDNYVAWTWKANGGTTSSNTDGSITSTVQANTTAGFSIVSYTGTGSAATIGHGLSATPKVVIVKRRTGTNNWRVYHESNGATKALDLDGNGVINTATGNWNDTAPTSSVFSVGTFSATNNNTDTYIAYCFAEKKGYSKFGLYVGNGNANGPFIYTGFKPAFVMIRNTGASHDWWMLDNKRDVDNPTNARVRANSSGAEDSAGNSVDFLSNGFKLKGTSGDVNESAANMIYMAFAENPLVANVSGGLPATAR